MWTLYWFELKMFMRDYRTIFFSVILPVLLMPVLFRSVHGFQERQERKQTEAEVHYVVLGPYGSEIRGVLRGHKGIRELPLDSKPVQHLKDGFFDVILEGYAYGAPPPHLAPPPGGKAESPRISGELLRHGPPQPDRTGIRLTYVDARERSRVAMNRMVTFLHRQLREYRDQKLEGSGLHPRDFLRYESQDQATEASRAGARLAPILPLLLVFLVLGGASVAAVDCVAGERERGTLETLLTTCLPQSSIVAGKQLAVLSLALFITLFELANLLLYLKLGWIEAADVLHLKIGFTTGLTLVVLSSVLALTVSSLLLYVSASSQNFKEAQLALFPSLILSIALTAAGTLPDLRLASAVAIVPLASISVAFRELLCDTPSWGALGVCVATHLLVSGGLLWASRSQLIPQGEFVRSSSGDSLAEQRRQDLRLELPWVFALVLAAVLTVPSNFPALISLWGQVLFNQGLMLLAPLLLLIRHGIPLREGFRVRRIGWRTLLACGLMAPLVQLCAQSTVWVTGEFLPVPEEMLKEMTRIIAPDSEPTWRLVLLLSLSPAICEELAFRGALLYSLTPGGEKCLSLRRKLLVSAIVGLAFGVFHLSFYRILPTAVTGFWLTLLALETGSIFPSMLVHFGNNALAVLAMRSQVELGNLPPWVWLGAWIGILLIFLWLRQRASKGT